MLLVLFDVCLFSQPAEAQYGRGIGLTPAKMQTASIFLDAGWDFVGETANGTEDIWWIDEGRDYPKQQWELQVGDAGTEKQ
ncbi:MAG: hypothetical protein ACETVZ_08655 [Phycisphaerae bacterium]